jgi:5-methylcytosine-specific restriction endonuclease McrA
MNERRSFIIELKEKRMSYTQIGNLLGISRQRVHQIIKGYKSPSHETPTTRIPSNWLASSNYDGSGIKLEGRDFLREVVRKRDNYTCQICLRRWQQGEKRLDVHHLDENWEGKGKTKGCYEYDKQNLDKLITLCHLCHMRLENVKRKVATSKH